MSGRKQHYIPQSLLKCFGKQRKGRSVQVTVYSRDHGVFTTSTDGVAAQRHFYSNPDDDAGVETLDNQITAFETRLAKVLAELRGEVLGEPVNATKAAEVVTHLCVRQAHLRTSSASGTGKLLDGMAKLAVTEKWQRKAMGLDDLTPNKLTRDTLAKFYDEYGQHLEKMGFTIEIFQQWAFDKLKAEFGKILLSNYPF